MRTQTNDTHNDEHYSDSMLLYKQIVFRSSPECSVLRGRLVMMSFVLKRFILFVICILSSYFMENSLKCIYFCLIYSSTARITRFKVKTNSQLLPFSH